MAEENEDKAPEAAAEGGAEAAPKKKLPMLLILGGTQTLATLGLGFVMITGLQKMNNSTVTQPELTERAIASVRDEAGKIQTVELEPFLTNTVTKNSLKATLNVEVSNEETANLIRARMPAIRARILNLLSQQDTKSLRKLQDKLLLKDALREAISQELAQSGANTGVIRDVYLMDFMVR